MQYWLAKTEPNTYSWEDLKNEKNRTTSWEGIRNYQVRNFIRDEIRNGDYFFIYHSVVTPMAIMGIARVVREAYPDHYAFDTTHKYYDPKSKPDNPAWLMFDIQAVSEFIPPVNLDEMKNYPELNEMGLLKKGNRLSIQKVTSKEWNFILSLTKVVDL